jgi:2-polyprenyl-3-methyl-5-hydroxy-6-metoxy-1,4-benzoquinol methylase
MTFDGFASPRIIDSKDDCFFYHVMEIPGIGMVGEEWDLRRGVDNYLGNIDFAGRRVLEIGPASGFLTTEMEKRGADVVAVEVKDEPGWDFVPYPKDTLEPIYGARRDIMRKLKNSFWFTHAAYGSKSRLIYEDVTRLPPQIGHFDIATMGSVLLHCGNPLQIISECAARADQLIITDLYYSDLEGRPICRLHPTPENQVWHTWWDFSTDLLSQFLRVLGFRYVARCVSNDYFHKGRQYELFTLAAHGR